MTCFYYSLATSISRREKKENKNQILKEFNLMYHDQISQRADHKQIQNTIPEFIVQFIAFTIGVPISQ